MSAHQSHMKIPPAYFKAVRAAWDAYSRYNPSHPCYRNGHKDHLALGSPEWMRGNQESLPTKRAAYFSALDCLLDELKTQVPIQTHREHGSNIKTAGAIQQEQGGLSFSVESVSMCQAAYETLRKNSVVVLPPPDWDFLQSCRPGFHRAAEPCAYLSRAYNYLSLILRDPFEDQHGVCLRNCLPVSGHIRG